MFSNSRFTIDFLSPNLAMFKNYMLLYQPTV